MSDAATTARSDLKTFASRVEERPVGAGRVLLLPTPVRSVVSFRGSFLTYPNFGAGEELTQELVVGLLDKGTRQRDRFAVAELLENKGAQLHFYTEGLRVGFAGRALREDVAEVFEILAEQLREPLFDEAEFDKVKAQVAASLRRSLESTGAQAAAVLSRRLFGPAHPNHTPDPAESLARLEALTVADVRAFHEKHFGADGLLMAVVGDLDVEAATGALAERLGDWAVHETPARYEAVARRPDPGHSRVAMPDKQNVDVRMGHALRLRRQDEAYIPLYLANYILGGNFSARLMTVVRDEMGLTYGIRSRFSGITTDYEGAWQVVVTLSTENVKRGLEATRQVVRRFIEEGATADELADKKTTITGSFKVGLATTGGLAHALLNNAERGFPVGYLDAFPAEIDAVTLEQLNTAIRRHFDVDRFHIAQAGMLGDDPA